RPTGIPRVLLSLTQELLRRRYANVKLCVMVGQHGVREIDPEEVFARFRPAPAGGPPPAGPPPAPPRRRWTAGLWPRRVCPASRPAPAPPLAPDPGPYDVLVSFGGGWAVDLEARLYRRLKQETGVRIVQVLYDLIPINFPQFFPPVMAMDQVF